MKKTLSIIMSAVLAMSGAAAMNSSALLIMGTEGSERYNSIVEHYNEVCIPHPEIVDDFNGVFPSYYNIKNVWLRTESTSQWSYCVIETEPSDMFGFDVLPEDRDAILEEISANLGYEDKFEILGDPYLDLTPFWDGKLRPGRYDKIIFSFLEDDHELNYMIAEKAYSLVKDKYAIDDIYISLAHRDFNYVDIQSYFSFVDGYKFGDEEYEGLKKEIYNSVDHEMLKEKYKATLTETGFLEFSEGYTEADKAKCFRYFAENYNTGIYRYVLASTKSASKMEADFDEINYLEGDANCDGLLTIADAATVLQALGNTDKYSMSRQGSFNADLAGDGLTTADALAIQKKLTEPSEK